MIFMVSAVLQSGYYHCTFFYPQFSLVNIEFLLTGQITF